MIEAVLKQAATPFTRWQRSLAMRERELKSAEDRQAHTWRQKELMRGLDGGAPALAEYLRGCLGLDSGVDIGAPPFPRTALTPREFREMPAELEVELAVAWEAEIEPSSASRPLYWLLCHIEWIEQQRFGTDRLHEYFTEGGGRRDSLDARTRTFLRRSGGLPHVRGNVSAHSDCPLARSWWRVRIATEATRVSDAGITRDEAHDVLRSSNQVWERLVLLALRRVTVVSQPRARAALIAALAARESPKEADVQQTAQALARAGRSRSLEHVPWTELREIAAADSVAGDSA